MKYAIATLISIIILFFSPFDSRAQCNNQDDYTALRALYLSSGGDNWTDNTNWPDSAFFANNVTVPVGLDMSMWYGISCEGIGRVKAVDLDRNKLTDIIPPELGNLTRLESLDLGLNGLTGEIPSELSNLTNLERLSLYLNDLTGEIPSDLGNLTNLKELSLYLNDLTGEIPSDLGNLTNLKELSIYSNDLTGQIPSALGNLTNLKELSLYFNALTGEIPSALGNLTNLKYLSLNFNALTGEIPSALGNLTNLEWLSLGSNALTGEIPSALGNLTNLKHLSLNLNALTGEIPSALGNLTNLEWLSLGSNALTGQIPSALGNLTNLKDLSLNSNDLTGEIPSSALGNLTNLEELLLSSNALTGQIPSELGNLTNLERLLLGSNDLTGEIPSALGNLTAVIDLKLDNNMLSGCYHPSLLSLYQRLKGVATMNYISRGNNFDATWDEFGETGAGICDCDHCTTGLIRIDQDLDGCDSNDYIASTNFHLNVYHDTIMRTFLTFNDGGYVIPLDTGISRIVPEISQNYYTVTPDTISLSWPQDSMNLKHDICLTPNGDFDDLKVTIIPINLARPGFEADYKVIYENQGTTTLSGKVRFTYFDADVLTFVSASPVQDSISGNSLIWNYQDLGPFEKRELMVTMKLNTPTDMPPLLGGEELNYTATIFPLADDETPGDNVFNLNQNVVNSYDPNDKTCLEGSVITEDMIGAEVNYLIRFENTGTASAINIKVTDTIDTDVFDISSLRLVDASHNCSYEIENEKVVYFYFDQIFLSHEDEFNDGYVAFSLNTKSTLSIGDSLTNHADIYFDFNPPIRTNTSTTHVKEIIPLELSISATKENICVGEQAKLQGLARGGSGNYSFSWTSDQVGFLSTQTNVFDNPIETRIYYLAMSDGENTLNDTLQIVVNENPVLEADVMDVSCFGVCDGSAVLDVTGGQWPYSYNLNTENLCADTYEVQAIDFNGCKDSKLFEVKQPEEFVITNIELDSTYFYSGGEGAIKETFEINEHFLVLSLEDGNGCIAKDSVALSFTTQTDLSEHIQIFPNPVNKTLIIKSDYEFEQIVLFDALGRTKLEHRFLNPSSEFKLDLENLSSGIYMVELKGELFRYVQKVYKN